jgi:glycosyltransferase involved in cell wall biosynthesis
MEISTIIPIYLNSSKRFDLLFDAVKSLEDQTSKPSEIVISDDTENMDIASLLSKLQDITKIPIKYLKNTSERGTSSNSNFGILKSNYELIHILHSDDQVTDKNFYKELKKIFQNEKITWVLASGNAGERELNPRLTLLTCFGLN